MAAAAAAERRAGSSRNLRFFIVRTVHWAGTCIWNELRACQMRDEHVSICNMWVRGRLDSEPGAAREI